jgi:6-pyruvoyl-tetrahydropterin synthase
MASAEWSESYRALFKRFCILTFASVLIFALMTFIIENYDVCYTNSEICKIIWQKLDFHIPFTCLTVYQEVISQARIKLYN